MLRILCIMLIGVLAPIASAKTFVPHRAIAVTIPDSWSPKSIDDGVEANSPDGELYVSIEMYDGNDSDDALADGLKGIAQDDVRIEPRSIKQKPAELHGLRGLALTGTGKSKDGPVVIMMNVFDVFRGKSVLVTVWGTPAGVSANRTQLQGILNSITRRNTGG